MHRRRRSAATVVERRAVEVELDWLGAALQLGLICPYTGADLGGCGALGLGADVILWLPFAQQYDALTAAN